MGDEHSSGRVIELDADLYDEALGALWEAATDVGREATGLHGLPEHAASTLRRLSGFGVGVVEGEDLVSAAVAMPALADDARSPRVHPGMMHISSVATSPGRWGEGLGRRAVKAILAQGKRRGFARAQLWTHAGNPGSRRLYESLGFALSGRTKVDDFGEDIVHYIRELTAEPVAPRPASRLLCCDEDDRVLLLNWRDPFDGFELWEPPGGGIEAGETPRVAVLREWAEETGLPAPKLVADPVVVGRDLLWLGDRYVGDEHFFLGRLEAAEPDVSGQTEIEQASYLGHRWMPWQQLADLDGSDEPDILAVLRRLDPEGPWAEPTS
ncbi:MAG: bifunctional GNAT family N-acetyltransferase/NUDIX hydrolase [Nocardioidaceae bacterium]